MLKFILFFFLIFSAQANYKTEQVYSGNGVVWGFSFINKDEILVTHRSGEFYYYNIKTKEKLKLPTPQITAINQGGLLDVLINGDQVYLTYSGDKGDKVVTSLAKAQYKNKSIQNLKTIFQATMGGNTGRHFGSRLVIKDNHLYMTIGDRGERNFAQSLSHHDGSILRLTLDGKAAPGNPFAEKKNALPEIYSWGHRNPQGIDIDPVSGEIYSCEFGPKGGDELNHIKPGVNYGWPVITYGTEYWGPVIGTTRKMGMEQPITYWTPSISPSGMVFYRGDKIPEWKNNLFLANLGSKHLRRLVLKDRKVIKQEELFKSMNERIRQVRNGLDGYLYFSTDSGKIFKVTK